MPSLLHRAPTSPPKRCLRSTGTCRVRGPCRRSTRSSTNARRRRRERISYTLGCHAGSLTTAWGTSVSITLTLYAHLFPRRTLGRRYFAPLRNGHKTAHLFTELATFHYLDDLAAPKRWFQAHVNEILRIYGPDHPIQREDILLGQLCELSMPTSHLLTFHSFWHTRCCRLRPFRQS